MLSVVQDKTGAVSDDSTYMANGWYLIDAFMPEGMVHLEVWAVLRFAVTGKILRIPLGASFKGRVFEVIRCPRAPHELILEAFNRDGAVEIKNSHVRSISGLAATYWIMRRVLGSQSQLRKGPGRRLGLGWGDFLRAPYKAYRILGSLRYHYPEPDFNGWRERYWCFTPQVRQRLVKHMDALSIARQQVRVLIDARQSYSSIQLEQTLESIRGQLGCTIELHILKQGDEPAAHGLSGDGWFLLAVPGQFLEPWAVAWFLSEAECNQKACLLYSDHVSEHEGNVRPEFKPDWSLDFHRVSHYTGDLLMVKGIELAAVASELGYVPGAYELLLELGARLQEHQVCHIPAMLWSEQKKLVCADRQQLQKYLQRHEVCAEVEDDDRGHPRIRYGLTGSQPLISIVIPTRDMLHFLQPCVDSILQKTTWSNYEVLILDNQSRCPDTLTYLEQVSQDARVRVLQYDHPFNFSAINNFAVEHAGGELICLLNNDTEVISPDWLDEMASRLIQPGVGAVGARLYFRDGRVQHAGDVVGPGGCANHLHGVLEADDPGYMNRAVLPQELSAVTAACLLTHRSVYQQLGGLDEHNLTVAFNDVDFCLRIREAGYRVIYTPYAELYHYESVSRGKDDNPEKRARAKREVQYMRERWAEVIAHDPFYNPNLNYARPDFTLGKYPRIDWPW